MANRTYVYLKTAAPASSDDDSAGYVVGDNWLDTTNDKIYKVIDVTTSAAIWYSLTSYPMQAAVGNGSFNPADATTYYFGPPWSSVMGTSGASAFPLYIPVAGRITKADVLMKVFGTLGTTETSTLVVRLNDTSDTTLTSAIDLSGDYHELVTGLSVSVSAGDYITCKWTTPTWSTNPTNVFAHVTFIIE